MKNLSFTIPVDEVSLRLTASMLNGMADTLYPTTSFQKLYEQEETFGESVEREAKEIEEAADKTHEVDAAKAFTPVELDKDGLPWDERIHAGTKTKVGDGTWKKKRGVLDATVVSVEAELRLMMGEPSPVIEQPAPKPPVIEQPAPKPPVIETGATEVTNFISLINAIKENEVPQETVNAMCEAFGIKATAQLASQPDQCTAFAIALGI